jgi:hypothetical protein
MLELNPETVLTLSSSILLRSVPNRDSYFAFDVVGGDQFQLNRTSFWILEAIGRGIRWEELCSKFFETFDVEPGDGLFDLKHVVIQSIEDGIVRRLGDG